MRVLINLFFSIILPISALFIVAAIIYFSISYDLNKALKLGVLAGFIIGFGFSFIISVILFIIRKIREKHILMTQPESHIAHESTNGPIDKKLMLLMDRELAFEVALYSIIDQNIGEVSKGSKREGTISIYTPEQMINLSISTLTKHTSQLEVKADAYNMSVQRIINYLKIKEQSFLQY
jgi:hypothetical protein